MTGAALLLAPAEARILDEVRLGAAAHSIDLNGGDPSPEGGADISLEALFAKPRVLRPLLAPRPYLLASFNSAGDTDFWSLGLNWRQDVASGRLFLEGEAGLARHNGVIDLPPAGDPARDDTEANRILFGSRHLFRVEAAVGVRLAPRWRVSAFYEHLSNAGLLNGGSERNQGLDNVGLRLGYTFGGGR